MRAKSAGIGMRAARSAHEAVEAGARFYERGRMLGRLVPVGLGSAPEAEPARTRRIVALLARELRAERALGRAGHWTYDINRHIGLMQAYKAETAGLAALRGHRP